VFFYFGLQIGDPNTHRKFYKKWIEMENDWSRASTKFRRQINTVDDEIKKKRNVRGVDGISNTVHPRSTMNFKLAI